MTKANFIEIKILCAVLVFMLLGSTANADTARLERGRMVFEQVAGIGCQGCHGEYGEGDLGVGPFIRGANHGMVSAAIEGIGAMVVIKAVIQPDEVSDVVEYLNYLGTLQVARTLAKRGRFLPEEFSTRPGTTLQIVIKNTSTKPHTFRSDNMDIEEITIEGRSTGSIVWKANPEAGQYSLYCIDCKLEGQFYRIKLDESAKKFNAVASSGVKASDLGM